MNNRRMLLTIIALTLLGCLVWACAAQPTQEVEAPAVEAEATQPQPAVEVEATQLPAAEEPAEEEKPAVMEPSATAPSLPSPPAPQPTAPPDLGASPTPIVEERLVEIEWPPRMRLGESDVVRLALIPTRDGYVLTTEFPEHKMVTQTVQISRPGGYDLFAVARLDGVGFEMSPSGEQVQYLPPDQALAWRWSLTPRSAGKQRLSLTLNLRWVPIAGSADTIVREVSAYSTGLDVQVMSLFGLSKVQTLFAGLVGLVFGGSLSLLALAYRPRSAHLVLKEEKPNRDLVIESPPGVDISHTERTLLQTLFRRYQRLVIKDEFLSGYSGARTFLSLPIRADGRADAHTIAKLGGRDSIRGEFENYETFVKDTLPPITARIQHTPVVASTSKRRPAAGRGDAQKAASKQGEWGGHMAALQYTFIGEPGSTPTSLRQALLKNPDPALIYQLFETFGPNWWMQRRPYTFRAGEEYDCMLPTHLVLEPAEGLGRVLDGRTPPAELGLKVGELVTLRDLAIEELRADGRSFSLIGEPAPGQPPLRVRWLSLDRPEGSTGRVLATRSTLLNDFVAGCDLLGLPNPLLALSRYLSEMVSGTLSTIHGDLNLENVLVGPGGLVWLIDFARTRDAHTLFDFAHLEAEIIAHVIAPNIQSPNDYLSLLFKPEESPFVAFHKLLKAVNEIATQCLFNPSQPREFRLSLALACLGALKFANLDQHAKHYLYLSAAYESQWL